MAPNPDPNSGMYPPPYPACSYPATAHPLQPAFNPSYRGFGGPYPPSQGYPPSGYPPPGGCGPPQGGGYPPAQGGYGPPKGGCPPPQGGYPPGPRFAPPPNQPAYPPPGGKFAPTAPISTQPTAQAQDGWMSSPKARPVNCPPGLEYLTTIDQLLVHQKVFKAFTGFEARVKYTVKNILGQKVFYAVEDSDYLAHTIYGPLRPFDMKIFDNFRNEVIHLYRPFACNFCWFPCSLQRLEVYAPLGTLAGTVEQEMSILTPQYSIKNAAGDTVLRIEGPFCTFSICGDVEFKVLTLKGAVVGKITKQWSGLLREMFTDADNFGITFPMDLDVKIKAVMLGACFLIDYMFFERKTNYS